MKPCWSRVTCMSGLTVTLTAIIPVLGCAVGSASPPIPRDPVFTVRSAILGILVDPPGEGQGPELHQIAPALRATSVPQLTLFGRTVTDGDQDDEGVADPIGGVQGPAPSPPPEVGTPPSPLQRDATSLQRQQHDKAVGNWNRRLADAQWKWLHEVRAQALAWSDAEAARVEMQASQLGQERGENLAGGPSPSNFNESYNVGDGLSRVLLAVQSLEAVSSPSIASRAKVIVVMTNLGQFKPTANLPPMTGVNVVLCNYIASATPAASWLGAFKSAGAPDVKVLDHGLTAIELPSALKVWLS
jgi:hypothetical protein